MIHQPLYRRGRFCLAFLAWMLGGFSNSSAYAQRPQVILRSFRNDTNMALYMQGATQVRGALVKGRPILLAPKQMIREIMPPTATVVTVFDAQQRVLYTGTILPATMDQLYALQMDSPLVLPNGTQVPRVKLVLVKPAPR
jgi:hypothetical protein